MAFGDLVGVRLEPQIAPGVADDPDDPLHGVGHGGADALQAADDRQGDHQRLDRHRARDHAERHPHQQRGGGAEEHDRERRIQRGDPSRVTHAGIAPAGQCLAGPGDQGSLQAEDANLRPRTGSGGEIDQMACEPARGGASLLRFPAPLGEQRRGQQPRRAEQGEGDQPPVGGRRHDQDRHRVRGRVDQIERHVERLAERIALVAEDLHLIQIFGRFEMIKGRDIGGDPGDLLVERKPDPLHQIDPCAGADDLQIVVGGGRSDQRDGRDDHQPKITLDGAGREDPQEQGNQRHQHLADQLAGAEQGQSRTDGERHRQDHPQASRRVSTHP